MALQELLLSSSSTLTCLHDVKTGSLLTSFKGTSSTGATDFSNDIQASSSSSTYGSNNNSNANKADVKGKNRAIDEEQSSIFKKTTDCVETRNGMGGIVASVIAGKAAINVWSYQKEAPMHRLLLPVKVSCLALSKTGTYLACGTNDGRLFLWEIATGSLLASFDGHYRAVTCISWTDDDAAFISGGDDSVCHVWSLPIVLAAGGNTLVPMAAYTSLTDHTLPITSLNISFGKFPKVRILTSSLDGTCKIWDLTLKKSNLLSTFNFNSLGTSKVTNSAWDNLERSFYAVLAFHPSSSSSSTNSSNAKEKSGRLVKVDLYRPVRENDQIPKGDDEEEDASHGVSTNLDHSGARWKALGGGGRGDITQVSAEESNTLGRFFSTPNDYISSIHVSALSSHVIVGTQSGKIHILSLPSMQNIRTIIPSQTSSISSLAAPVAFIQSMIRPVDLISRTGTSSSSMHGSKANEAEILPRPVAAQLSRTILPPFSKEAEERVVSIRLTGNGDNTKNPFSIDDIVLPPQGAFTSSNGSSRRRYGTIGSGSLAGVAGPNGSGANVQTLQEENARLREQLARAVAFNDRMWESVVDGTLAKAKEGKLEAVKANGMHVD